MILACLPDLTTVVHRLIQAPMSLFGKKTTSKPVQNALLAFSARLAVLEREQRSLKLEFLETYDKVNRLMARVAKRAALDNPKPPEPPDEALDQLSRSDSITAEILARRSKGMNS